MLSNERAKQLAKLLLAILVAVFSAFVLANLLPNAGFAKSTIENLENSQKTILEFSGATISASVALSALPNDFASPVAGLFADMNKYAALALAMVLFEKIIMLEGIHFCLKWIIPAACVLYIVYLFVKKEAISRLTVKITVLALAVILVVPLSTVVSGTVGERYMDYVESTIAETNENIAVIETAGDSREAGNLLDRVSAAFQNAADGVSRLVDNFKVLAKKCASSLAILILNTFVAPLLVFTFLRWLLKELFSLNLPAPQVKLIAPKSVDSHGAEREEEEEATVC